MTEPNPPFTFPTQLFLVGFRPPTKISHLSSYILIINGKRYYLVYSHTYVRPFTRKKEPVNISFQLTRELLEPETRTTHNNVITGNNQLKDRINL